MTTLTAYIEFDEATQLYVGIVPGIPGAHTQAASLDELRANFRRKSWNFAWKRTRHCAIVFQNSWECNRSRWRSWRA